MEAKAYYQEFRQLAIRAAPAKGHSNFVEDEPNFHRR